MRRNLYHQFSFQIIQCDDSITDYTSIRHEFITRSLKIAKIIESGRQDYVRSGLKNTKQRIQIGIKCNVNRKEKKYQENKGSNTETE